MIVNRNLTKKIILIFNLFNTVSLVSEQKVFFSPKDRIEDKLIKEINQVQNKIRAAVYMITNKRIANALIKAKKERNISVKLVTDKSCLESGYGKVKYLKKAGIKIFIYDSNIGSKNKIFNPIMHNKFVIFDNKKVWTGSFNWTVSASKINFENVLLTDNEKVCNLYIKEFKFLKKICGKTTSNFFYKSKYFIQKNSNTKKKFEYTKFQNKLFNFMKNIRKKLKSN